MKIAVNLLRIVLLPQALLEGVITGNGKSTTKGARINTIRTVFHYIQK
jgi:hypothetical protein